jgi:hypothetical protein
MTDPLSEAVLGTAGDLGLVADDGMPEAEASDGFAADDDWYSDDETAADNASDHSAWLTEARIAVDDGEDGESDDEPDEPTVADTPDGWRAEAEQHFPLADFDTIHADSRHDFLAQALASHERTEGRVSSLQAARDAAERERPAALADEGDDEPEAPVPATTGLADARRRGSLADAIRARIDANEV